MKLEQSFSVAAPIDEVWNALIDVQRVAPCLPGAEITDRKDDGSYAGTFTVKLGPTTAIYNGVLRLESLNPEAHVATMNARGTDKRGRGGASATIVSTMREDGTGTVVDVVTDFTITGRLASFGRGGMIQDISKRLMRDFADCLQASLATPVPAPAAAPGGAPADRSEPAAAPAPVAQAAEPTQPVAQPARPMAQPAKPVKGLSLLFSILVERVKALFGRRR
jgi:carbon monoxide dehydrogenase subunit G